MEVLVVEANRHDVAILKRRMRENNVEYELHFTYDGAEALDFLYRRGRFTDVPKLDLILLALNLPKVNGLEVLTKIKEDERLRRIPVIVYSGSERPEDMVQAYDSGAASYMTKSADPEDFKRLLQTMEDHWRIAKMFQR